MRLRALLLVIAAACGSKSDSKSQPTPEPAPKPAPATTPAPAAKPAPAVASKKVVDLSTLKDATDTANLINATIEVPADATVEIETKTVGGTSDTRAKIRIEGIEIDPKMAEMTSADIDVSELPSPLTFDSVKSTFKPAEIVRAEQDPDGYTFLTKVGDDFAVTVQRGTYLCSSVGGDGTGLLEPAAKVTLDVCRSLKPKK